EDLREEFVQIDASRIAAKAKHVRSVDPADRVDEVEGVLILKLICWRRRPELESGAGQRELINRVGHAVRRTINSQIGRSDRRNIDQTVVDVHKAKPKIIHECRREEMCFAHAEETGV